MPPVRPHRCLRSGNIRIDRPVAPLKNIDDGVNQVRLARHRLREKRRHLSRRFERYRDLFVTIWPVATGGLFEYLRWITTKSVEENKEEKAAELVQLEGK